MKPDLADLKQTVERLHGGTATYVETVPVKEAFGDKVIWQGDVEVFDLADNPKVSRAYAWMHGLDDMQPSGTLRFMCLRLIRHRQQ